MAGRPESSGRPEHPRRIVVPDCGQDGRHHDPPGPAPAAFIWTYFSEYCLDPCPPFHGMTLCAACCARLLSLVRDPEAGRWAPPEPVSIRVVRDANTGFPVIPARTFPPGPRIPRFLLVLDPALSLPCNRVQVLLELPG